MWGEAILDSLCRVGQSVGRSVRPSPILVRSLTPLLMEGFPSNLNDTFISTSRAHVAHVSGQGQGHS